MKRWLLAAACGAVALGLLLYPLVGELLSEKYHSDIETAYTAAIEDTNTAELERQRQAAQQYNAMLSGAAITEGGASAPPLAYDQQLTVGSVMCYVDIPKIGVYLPVEHGMSADTLEKSVGHVVGTSLPVGGANTHAVLSAHSGMASSKLFSDIDQLAEGDIFYIHVLGDTLTYQVDNIATVLPTDTSLLQIEDGKDLVTLVTCTPFGVNTHRLLVRGERTEYIPPEELAEQNAVHEVQSQTITKRIVDVWPWLVVSLLIVAGVEGSIFLLIVKRQRSYGDVREKRKKGKRSSRSCNKTRRKK